MVRKPFIEQVQRPVPPGSMMPNRATSAQGIAACAASLQGFDPFAGWRRRFRISPFTTPWLSWPLPSLGCSPSPALSLSIAAPPLLRARRHNPTRLPPMLPPVTAVLGFYLSGTSGKVPFWVLIPMLQSFKEQGSWRYLFRGSRPLEVLVLISTRRLSVGTG